MCLTVSCSLAHLARSSAQPMLCHTCIAYNTASGLRIHLVVGALVLQPACKHCLKLVCQYLAMPAHNSPFGKDTPLLYNLTYACRGRRIQEYTMQLCEPQRCYRSYARGVTPHWTWAICPPGPLQVNVHTSADLKQSTSIGQLSHLHCSSCKLICSRATATKEEKMEISYFSASIE